MAELQSLPIRVLLGESNTFHRLVLTDMLELCHYDVVAVENGSQAREELENGTNYDLALFEFLLPEIDGLELLTLMKMTEKLKDIPVVLICEGQSEDEIGVMNPGIKGYLLKPIRFQDVRGLAAYVIPNPSRTPLAKFTSIRPISKAPTSSVTLVKNIEDGQNYVLKTIRLEFMSHHDRELIEDQVGFLKMLTGPFILRYYGRVIENETMSLIVEDGGENFSQVISKHTLSQDPIPDQQIFEWISQLFCSILLIHSKNVLLQNRIKTQNIFLTKDNTIKLDIFSTAIQTLPHLMPPEVWQGGKHSQKSDIWVLGCVIYELAALKRPFDSTIPPDLMQIICETEPPSLPKHISPGIKMLVSYMLQKDPIKRPSIYDISQTTFIREQIFKFIRGKDDEQIILGMLTSNTRSSPLLIPLFFRLEDLADKIRSSIELKVLHVGFLRREEKVFTGEDLVNWFQKELQISDLEEIHQIIVRMMKQDLLHSPNGFERLKNTSKAIYRFQADKPGVAANMLKIFKENLTQDHQKLIQNLITRINEILNEIRVEVNSTEVGLNIEKLKSSIIYEEFKNEICRLQIVPMISLTEKEKIAFFLNVYQIMHVHKLFRDYIERTQAGGLFKKIKNLAKLDSGSRFYYNVGQSDFTIEDIVHGVLRGNKKAPNAYYFKNFSQTDPRNAILQIHDPRVIFVLLPEDFIPKSLEIYIPASLDEKLDKLCKEYLSNTVFYDPNENELILPDLLKSYKDDFGSQRDLIHFVKFWLLLIELTIRKIFKYNKFTNHPDRVCDLIKEEKLFISFSDE